MTEALYCLDPPVEVRLRRNARARRLTLRVSKSDGAAYLTLPPRTSLREAQSFLDRQEGWLEAALSQTLPAIPVEFGSELPLDGRLRRIEQATGGRITVGEDVIAVPAGRAGPGPRLKAFLKELCRDRLTIAADDYAATLKRAPGRVTIRDPKSRWGSCTSEGNLMFSWRLIMAPASVSDYVAAHEAAHLVEMNHSAAFWRRVADICPDYRTHRQWLRDNGATLHRYRF